MKRREGRAASEARQVGVRLDPALWRELRILAIQTDRSATEVLHQAISEFMARERQGRAPVPKRRLSGRPVERGI
jgi:hypothetical protein